MSAFSAQLRHRVQRAAWLLRPSSWPPPSVVTEEGAPMFLDPTDARAAYLKTHRGVADPVALTIWRHLAARFRPTFVIDVGANYGEFILGVAWAGGPFLLAVEANPGVAAHLGRSLAELVDLRYVLASVPVSSSTSAVSLAIDGGWSGRTRMAEGSQGKGVLRLAASTVDEVVLATAAAEAEGSRLLMKVDVQGSEIEVLRGASQTLSGVEEVILLIEIHHLGVAERVWLREEFVLFRGERTTFLPLQLSDQPSSTEPKDAVCVPRRCAVPSFLVGGEGDMSGGGHDVRVPSES